jgi:EAL domain-containing protein (putative c-di-GMP-specific phosphodiesterase class I)
VPVVLETLRQTGMNPGDLCLEITEGVLMEDVDSAMQELHSLRNLGVELSIDDFGRGYSSLSYLKQLPIARVKLDRLFVDDLGHDPQTSAIAGAVVDLVHALGLTVVAEGVETAKQLEALQTLGCDMAQGYYFARPQSAEAIDELIARGAR